MFGTNLECVSKAVKVKVVEYDGRVIRRCRVLLVHEFTDDIAAELGKDAKQLLKSLDNQGVSKAELPITAIAAVGAFRAPDGSAGVQIGCMAGVKAVATAPKGEDEAATIQFEFEFAWQEDAWVFLGRHCAAVASVVLTKTQLALSNMEATAN
jgi:hypothetical protein